MDEYVQIVLNVFDAVLSGEITVSTAADVLDAIVEHEKEGNDELA